MKHKREKKEILGDLAPHIGRPRTRAGSWGVPSASYRISPIHLVHWLIVLASTALSLTAGRHLWLGVPHDHAMISMNIQV